MHTISAGTRSSSINLTSSWTGSAVAAMAAGTGTALLSEDSDSSIVMWNQYAHQSYEARQVGKRTSTASYWSLAGGGPRFRRFRQRQLRRARSLPRRVGGPGAGPGDRDRKPGHSVE